MRGKKQRQSIVQVKPYTLQRRPWFESVFVGNRAIMERSITTNLRNEIGRAARGNSTS